jgi:hypothetical protein
MIFVKTTSTTIQIPDLDPNEIIRKLKVDKLATRAGKENLPEPGDEDLDMHQKGIVNLFQSWLAKLNAQVDNRLKQEEIHRAECLRRIRWPTPSFLASRMIWGYSAGFSRRGSSRSST